MKRRFLPTFVAVIVFILLLVYASIYETEEIPAPGQDKPVEMARFSPGEVKALVWKTVGQPEIRAEVKSEKGQDRFELVKPVALRGEEQEFAGVLRNFENLKSAGTIAVTATGTQAFGLGTDSPSITLESATRSVTLTLGSDCPIGNSFYMQKSGDPNVYLVSGAVSSAFRKSVNDLRSKNVFFEDFADISSVSLNIGTQSLELEKATGLAWTLKELAPEKGSQPLRTVPADSSEVSQLIFGVHDLRVARFVTDVPTASDDYGFNEPTLKAVLHDTKGNEFSLVAGKTEGGRVFVRRGDQPSVYSVENTSLDPVRKPFDLLRSKEMPPVSGLKKITLKTASGTRVLELASSTWTCEGVKVAEATVNALTAAYSGNRVKVFLPEEDRKTESLTEQDSCDRLTFEGDSGKREVVFGKGDGTHISLVVDDEKEIRKVPIQTYEAFRALFQAAAAPAPTPTPPATPATPKASGTAAASSADLKASEPAPVSPKASEGTPVSPKGPESTLPAPKAPEKPPAASGAEAPGGK